MIVLFRKDNILSAKVLMDLRLPIQYKNKVFNKGKQELYLEPEEVLHILTRNGNIQIWNGKKYVKLHLGQFYELIQQNKYLVEEVVVPKKVEQPKPEPKVVVKEEPKPEVVEEPKVEEVKEVVKEEPKQQPKKEENKQHENNKKQRHNNNNKQNQGGDK